MSDDERRQDDQDEQDNQDRQAEQDDRDEQDEENPPRTTAEWVTLSISIAILALLFGAIGFFYLSGNDTVAIIEVTPLTEQVRAEGEQFLLPVEITNTGEQTASSVSVTVSLMVDGEEEQSADFSVDFLAGGASERGVALFTTDPATGEITVTAVSYMEP